jgi:putative membrane protein
VTQPPEPAAAPPPILRDTGATAPQRTHPSSVVVQVLRAVPLLLGALVVVGVQGGQDLSGRVPLPALLLVGAAGLLALTAVIALSSYLSWSRRAYWFDDSGDLRVDSGVLTRQQRRLALSRLQSVDVNQPLLARLVGLAELRVEVAGAGDSRVVLQYLTEADAQALRGQVLARAAGLRPDAGTAPQHVLVTVPVTDLVVSLVLSTTTIAGVLATAGVVTIAVLTEGAVGLVALLISGGIPIFSAFGQFVRFFGFTVAESPDGLRLRSGLTTTRTQTVPPGRVHAIEVEQPFLWRSRDWVRVQLTIAGSPSGGDGQDSAQTSGVLLPVAPRPVAQAVLDRVLPGAGSRQFDWQGAPERARWRAPIQWRQLAVASDEEVFACRRGRLVRRVAMVPHARMQSVHVEQGPWQRWLRLATVRLDLAPGPVAAIGLHQDASAAREVADGQATRAKHARATAGPQRWMAGPPTDAPAVTSIAPETGAAGSQPE